MSVVLDPEAKFHPLTNVADGQSSDRPNMTKYIVRDNSLDRFLDDIVDSVQKSKTAITFIFEQYSH